MRTRGVLTALAVGALLAGCTTTPAADVAPSGAAAGAAAAGEPRQEATKLLQVSEVHDATGMTLLEGPTFGPNGELYLVDVTAPAGEPKVMRLNTDTQAITPVYTDDSSAFSSAQFSPFDGRLYLSDIAGGTITSITADGQDPRTFFSGDVDGQRVSPDDIAFNEAGDLYVSDFTAFPGVPVDAAASGGRVVRLDHATAAATVVAKGLPSPNGISFTADFSGLWLGQYSANRIDLLSLSPDGMAAAALHPAMYVSGGASRVDSTAVDAAGNVYQGFEGEPRIHVYSPAGELLTVIEMPDGDAGLASATNVAIEPGTTNGFVTVSGDAGGFVYTFTALGEGSRQSNGG